MMNLRHFLAEGSRLLPVQGVFLIGSAPDCDLVLNAPGIPGILLELKPEGNRLRAKAEGEVLWNGKNLKQADLRPGDRLELGGQILVLEQASAAVAESPDSLSPGDKPGFPWATALADFAQQAAQEPNLQRLLERSLDRMMELLHGTEAFLFTLAPDGSAKSACARGVPDVKARFSDSIVQEVLRTGKAVALADAAGDARFGAARSVADLKLRSVLCVPMALGGKITGVVYLGSRGIQTAYGPADQAALQAFAQVLGLLVQHVEFIAQQGEALRHLAEGATEAGLIAHSPAMQKLLRQADSVAVSDIAVLFHGETGSGKELLAERLHRKSPRAAGPFVAVNCSALKNELLESELFGHKKGSFTGAVQDKSGLFSAAHGGTLFLDEIGDLDPGLQAKLLRALETGKIRPVGGTAELAVDVRVIAATHRDLQALIAEKGFREDLYYRLAQITLELPSLRERAEDIPLLAQSFLERFKAKYPSKELRGFEPASLAAMVVYAWPGNVRELLNAVHKAVLLSDGPLVKMEMGTAGKTGEPEFLGMEEATRRFQKQYLEKALALGGGNREQAAKILGMSRSTFFRYLAELGAA